MPKNEKSSENSLPGFKAMLILNGIGIIVAILLLAVGAMLINACTIPESYSAVFVLIVTFISSFIASFQLSRRTASKKLVCSLISGLIFFVLLIFFGLFFDTSFAMKNLLLSFGTIMISSIIAGFSSVNSRVKKY